MTSDPANDPPLRAALYRRISEKDNKFDKVENQERNLREFAAKQGYTVVADYCDDGISAYKDDVYRPQWNKLLGDIPRDQFDVIIATFEARLSRQIAEKVVLLTACQKAGVRWHTLHNGKVDPSDSTDALIAIIQGWQAETEVTNRVQGLKDRFARQRSDGLPLWGVRPFGFEKDRRTHFHGSAERPYDEAAEVRWAYEQIDVGATIYSVVKSWNDRGIQTTSESETRNLDRRWSYASVQQLLKRPRNAALMEIDGEIDYAIDCKWEPLVDRDLFERVRAKVTRDPGDERPRVFEPRWLLAGIARCGECSRPMRSTTAGGGRGKQAQPGYRCNYSMKPGVKAKVGDDGKKITHATASADLLDAMARDAVVTAFLLAPTALRPSDAGSGADLRKAETELQATRKEMQTVSESIGLPGFKTQTLRKRAAELAERESALEAEIAGINERDANSAMIGKTRQVMAGKDGRVSLDKMAERKAELEQRFDSLHLRQRRDLVTNLLDVVVFPGRRANRFVVWHKVATSLNDAGDTAPEFLRPIESAISA